MDEVPNDGLIRYMHAFNQERVAVVGPTALREVLVSKSYDFVKPRQLSANIGRIIGLGILFAEGDEHKVGTFALLFDLVVCRKKTGGSLSLQKKEEKLTRGD